MGNCSLDDRKDAVARMRAKAEGKPFVPVDRAGRPLEVEEPVIVEGPEIEIPIPAEDPQEAASPPADGDLEGEGDTTPGTDA
jgi:hypothetical protein